jgi:hypothetical protein
VRRQPVNGLLLRIEVCSDEAIFVGIGRLLSIP